MSEEEYQSILNEYRQVVNEICECKDPNAKNVLKQEMTQKKGRINQVVQQEVSTGVFNNNFVAFVSNVDALDTLLEKNEQIVEPHNNYDIQTRQLNNYDLTSSYVIDEYNDTEIWIGGMSIYDKIKYIYNYSGILISTDDKQFEKYRDTSFSNFMHNVVSQMGRDFFKSKYGNNWLEEIERIYKDGYNSAVQNNINQIANTVDKENREKYCQLSIQLSETEKERDMLIGEVDALKQEVENLKNKIITMKAENKNELFKYRDVLTSVIKDDAQRQSNSKFAFTVEEKKQILEALNINLVADKDEEKRKSSFTLVQDENESIQSLARKMTICKYLDITVDIDLNGKNFNNKNFEDESQFLAACNNTNNVIVEPTGKSI